MASIVERMIGAATLNVQTYEEVEKDTSATQEAMIVVVLSSVAAGIGAIGSGIMSLVLTTVLALVAWGVMAAVTFFVGTKLLPEPQTDSDIGELLRTLGFAAAPGILRIVGIIPVIGWLMSFAASLWMLVTMVIAVRQALDYNSTPRAIAVSAIGWVVNMIIMMVLGGMIAGTMALGGAFG